MIVANYLVAVALFALGVATIVTRRTLIKIVMGLSLIESSSYLLLLSMAYRRGSTAPMLLKPPGGQPEQELAHGNVADPVLQNICLTAIVIGVAVTAVLLVTVVRIAQHYRTMDADRVRDLRG
ncbi:NADH-quinone oxidoreductase subunit K [Kribbella sp. NPDC059898]|uniref:NADH-quinone oxidoreductase subunit K n=1 Tax=Kribbella sp. NPDC059898 TaxID=3346995 RepID=UPI0036502BA0